MGLNNLGRFGVPIGVVLFDLFHLEVDLGMISHLNTFMDHVHDDPCIFQVRSIHSRVLEI